MTADKEKKRHIAGPTRFCSVFIRNIGFSVSCGTVFGVKRMSADTVKAVLLLKVNIDDACSVFPDKFIQNTDCWGKKPVEIFQVQKMNNLDYEKYACATAEPESGSSDF